jgi:GNAT superfamily N-acetyltransferase
MRAMPIRCMSRAEIDLAVNWAAGEGWNPGRHDAGAFHAADPRGFLIGSVGDEPAAIISVVRYPENFGFLGFYIVARKYRGRGFGFRLWRTGMKRLAGCNVGLDGVPEQQPNYRKSGFRLAYRNIRYSGPLPDVLKDRGLVPAAAVPFDRLLAYDRKGFPAPRPAFLSAWLSLSNSASLVSVKDGRIAGFGTVRACRKGHKIGPLFADDEATAHNLFHGLCRSVKRGPLFIDVPEINPAAIRIAERHGLAPAFETARMYTGPEPDIDVRRVFGVTSFELG